MKGLKIHIFLIFLFPLGLHAKDLIIHEGYLSIRNTTRTPLIFQYAGASQQCVLVPNPKPIRLNPGEGVLLPIQFSEPCEAQLQFRIVKVEQMSQRVDLLPNFISKERVQQALRRQKYPTKVL